MKANCWYFAKYLISVLFLLVCPIEAYTQDTVTTRTVRGVEKAEDAEVKINQIDTSQFPKVTIFASVLKDNVPVTGLTEKDFRVREDEVDQEPLTVVPKLSPLSVVVALDTSGSMKKALSKAQMAAGAFIDALEAEDQVLALSFARKVEIISPMTREKADAKAAISATRARGDTALYDALYSSVDVLKDRPGRKAIILLSDGVDDDGYGKQLSKHSVSEVLQLARKVNVPIFTIGLGPELDEKTLQTVAQDTGAGYYHAPEVDALKQLYDSIGKQLAGQYNIYYTSNLPGDGSTHRVRLSHGNNASIKEYTSPMLERKVVKVVTQPKKEPTPQPEKKRVKISLPKLGTITIPNFSEKSGTGYVALTHQEQKKKVDSFHPKYKKALDVIAGTYTLTFGEYVVENIEVEGGQTLEYKLGAISIPNFSKGSGVGYVEIREQESEKKLGSLHPKYAHVLDVPPGTYTLGVGQYRVSDIKVAASERVDYQLGAIDIPNFSKGSGTGYVEIREQESGKKLGSLHPKYAHVIDVPPGTYTLSFGQGTVENIAVGAGETVKYMLGAIRINFSERGQTGYVYVTDKASGKRLGSMHPKYNHVLDVPPGLYVLKIGQVGADVQVEANQEVLIE